MLLFLKPTVNLQNEKNLGELQVRAKTKGISKKVADSEFLTTYNTGLEYIY